LDARPVGPSNGEREAWIAALKEKDPGFDLQALSAKVSELFVKAQKAWSARNLEPVRPFMSDASYQRFLTQLELMKAQNVRNVIADPQVLGVTLVGIEQNPWFDTVQLSIRARMRDTDVPWITSDLEANAEAKRARASEFEEVWSFVRKPGAQTKSGQDLFSGKCPNCGAPFKGGAANSCEYCGAVVNSGNYDWTLAEITQSVEAGSAQGEIDGLDGLRAVDPAFSVEMLEDRASLVFWKWVEARSTGEPKRLAKLASPSGLEEVDQQLRRRGTKVFAQCAVGAVNTVRVAAQGDAQVAEVEIRWSANIGGLQSLVQSTFRLTRGAGAKTNSANGMSTSRCPSCNAPLTASLSPTCDYCGAELSSGQGDWVLASTDVEL
jgi:predicted lipid-binding transport protein (Tim44 family)